MIFINPQEIDQDIEKIMETYKPQHIEEMKEEIRRIERIIKG